MKGITKMRKAQLIYFYHQLNIIADEIDPKRTGKHEVENIVSAARGIRDFFIARGEFAFDKE